MPSSSVHQGSLNFPGCSISNKPLDSYRLSCAPSRVCLPTGENHRPPIRKTFQFSCWPMFKVNCIGTRYGSRKLIARNELWDGLLFLFSLLSIIVTRNDCARNELLSLLRLRIKSWSLDVVIDSVCNFKRFE